MEKSVTETKRFCDFCEENKEEQAYVKCFLCKKDICEKHALEIEIRIHRQSPGFLARLCPYDAAILDSFMMNMEHVKADWDSIGQNPEYNEARLREIRQFRKKASEEAKRTIAKHSV